MNFLIELKKKIFNNPRVKEQFYKYCLDFQNPPKSTDSDLEPFYLEFGNYILNSENFSKDFFEFSKNLAQSEQKDLLMNIVRTAIIYRSHGKINTEYLRTAEEKNIIEQANDFMSKVVDKKDYFELDGYKLPINFFLREIFYEKLFLNKANKDYFSNKDIIDAGACIGDSSLILSENTNKNVYAFEPSEKNYSLMLKTIELNKKENIVPVKLGLGDKAETLNLKSYSEDNIGGFTLLPDSKSKLVGEESVEIATIDSYVEKNNIEVGLIKADVEGFEQKLLAGAKNTIEKFKPTLMLCIYHSPDDFFKIKAIIESFNLGYKVTYSPSKAIGHFITETMIIAQVNP